MRYPNRGPDAAEARREASAWAAKMRGPEAGRLRLEFERWRAASPINRRLYDEMQMISRQAQEMGTTSMAREYYRHRDRRSFFSRPGATLVAACAAAILAVGLSIWLVAHDRGNPVIASSAPLATAVGHIGRVRLADGTLVILDTDSEIAPAFDRSTRLVRLLRGRARFDVAQDAGRPFMVVAGNRTILDRGTVFDVALGREGVKVTLLRGAVEIRDRRSGGIGTGVARLVPGQMFVEKASSGGESVSAAGDGAGRWTSGMLSYDGAPLSEVVADANRYSVRQLRLADPSLASLRVTGVFKASPIEGVAPVLATVLKLRVATAPNGDLTLQR